MRRSERKKRSPARYSPPLPTSTSTPIQKSDIMAKYMSKNVKYVSSDKPKAAKSVAASVPEHSLANPQITSRGIEVLSKYAKAGEPSIVEIFGAIPDSDNMEVDSSQMDDVDVTGEDESKKTKERPSWIELGPLECKTAPHQCKSSSIFPIPAQCFGIPEAGCADIISESAGIPQSGFPIDGCSGIEGASHPDNKSGSKGLAPQKKKLIQQHLLLLLHAYKCERVEVTKIPCPVPFCSVMKKVQAHMRVCIEGYFCAAPFCSSSRRIMCHWKHCKTPDCVVCSRLKCLAMHKRKKELEKMKAMGEVPPPAVVKVVPPQLAEEPNPMPVMNNAA